MVSPTEIAFLFEERYSKLNEETILLMNDKFPGGELNNVVVGLNNHCYGLFLTDDPSEKIYVLFYVDGQIKLEGHALELTIDHLERDNLVFYFSDCLSLLYKGVNTLDAFNTFQTHTRSLLEKLGYFTVNPETFKKYNDPDPLILVPNTKGIIRVPIFEKSDFFKAFFKQNSLPKLKEGDTFIYLMINIRNNLFKIGSSKDPYHREKTLQGQEPEIELIATWSAQKNVENQLHKKYKSKRKRGEWFDLTMEDLKLLKTQMNQFI